ncbi:heat shock protein Hsp20 [Rubrobacter xylanophilus DSM 9941]|uniref:Heat shock protein Hsp20 n=2 Tax=Rubrobacter xylanophilus TaxID=49319 RepID=Q1AXA2_RUBXD|nr:heat shock protein Hsp20 [Rubrobacter xylanophilus DSM 9941]
MLSPFRGFWDVRSELDRMFDDVVRDAFRLWRGEGRAARTAEWAPAIDVYSKDGDLVIKAELPGMKPEDVDITLQEGVLTISGERKAEEEREGAGYFVRERRYGSFRRSMRLPEGVDESKIHARFEDGVLEVVVEGAGAVTEPRRIQIEAPKGS